MNIGADRWIFDGPFGGTLQLTEPGYIDCLFRTQPGMAVVVETALIARKQVVFSTRSEPITTRGEATFRAGIAIPADLLNEQPYQAHVRLHVRPVLGGDYTVVAEERLDFSALNPHPERSVWNDWPWGRGGLISPRLSWSVAPAGTPIASTRA